MEIYQNLANPSTSCFVNFLKTIFQISFLSYFFFAFDIYTDVEVIKAFKGEYQHANVSDEEMNVLVLGSKKWAKFPQIYYCSTSVQEMSKIPANLLL